MMLTIQSFHSPAWLDTQHKAISCVVKFAEIADEVHFVAMQDDPEQHGRDLFRRLSEGEAGEIAAFFALPSKGQKVTGGPNVIA